jgi:hypothetical protein
MSSKLQLLVYVAALLGPSTSSTILYHVAIEAIKILGYKALSFIYNFLTELFRPKTKENKHVTSHEDEEGFILVDNNGEKRKLEMVERNKFIIKSQNT